MSVGKAAGLRCRGVAWTRAVSLGEAVPMVAWGDKGSGAAGGERDASRTTPGLSEEAILSRCCFPTEVSFYEVCGIWDPYSGKADRARQPRPAAPPRSCLLSQCVLQACVRPTWATSAAVRAAHSGLIAPIKRRRLHPAILVSAVRRKRVNKLTSRPMRSIAARAEGFIAP